MNLPIHPTAAKGFQSSSDTYEKGRPEYPKEAVDSLIQALEITPKSSVIDMAAGTGKFTRQSALSLRCQMVSDL